MQFRGLVRVLSVVSAAALVVCCAPSLLAQGGRASITGVVSDSSGAVVPNVTITAINAGTGLTTDVTTSEIGSFTIPLLPVGSYTLTARKDGFKTETRSGIILTA